MKCFSLNKLRDDAPELVVNIIRAYNIVISILAVSGNAILIGALRKTGQTKTISMKYIIYMSTSDAAAGVISLVFTTLATYEEYAQYCWLRKFTKFSLNSCSTFSFVMIALIALDRYLHMKYLERYALIFTEKRGHYLAIAVAIFALGASSVLILPLHHVILASIRAMFCTIAILACIVTIVLYSNACKILHLNASKQLRSAITENRALGKAAKRITVCLVVLAIPYSFFQIFYKFSNQYNLMDEDFLIACIWLSYITYLSNGFCSSLIFMAQNRPVTRLLGRAVRNNCHCISSAVGIQ